MDIRDIDINEMGEFDVPEMAQFYIELREMLRDGYETKKIVRIPDVTRNRMVVRESIYKHNAEDAFKAANWINGIKARRKMRRLIRKIKDRLVFYDRLILDITKEYNKKYKKKLNREKINKASMKFKEKSKAFSKIHKKKTD